MSEFKCPEPGCDYHVGISNGPNLTAEDWEAEQYYFQEIEEHQQMHEKQKRANPLAVKRILAGNREKEILGDMGIENIDLDGVWIKVSDQVAKILDFHRVVKAEKVGETVQVHANFDPERRIKSMESRGIREPGNELMLVGVERKFRSGRGLEKAVHAAARRLPLLPAELEDRLTYTEQAEYVEALTEAVRESEFVKEVFDASPGSSGPGHGMKVPPAVAAAEGESLSGSSLSESVALLDGLRGLGRENDGHSAGNEELLDSLRAVDLDPRRSRVLERIFNDWSQGGEVFVVFDQDLVRAIKNVVGHETSLSVDGALKDAGVGTSESTERVQNPDVPEMKMPPAVAAAEGNETKNSHA